MDNKAWKSIEHKTAIVLLFVVLALAVSLYVTIDNLYLRLIISIVVPIVVIVPAYITIRRIIRNAETTFRDVSKEKANTEETMLAIMNASPMCCHYWDRDFNIINCNEATIELFGYKSKEEYIEKWIEECNPEFQPNGQATKVMGQALLQKAFAEGKCVFDWMHCLPDGTPIPAEVTFVRVKSGDDYFVAGYTRDLRREKTLEEKAGELDISKLTGVYTRTYLESRIERLIRLLSRTSGEMSVIMVSIDFINKYYDVYGAGAGDKCIKAVTDILSTYARRADDFVAEYRYGDFAIVLPGTGQIGAQLIAQNLVDEMHERNIAHKKNSAASHVTLSMGVTTGKVFHRQRADDYLRRTEEMLYISKQCGRNRFTWAEL